MIKLLAIVIPMGLLPGIARSQGIAGVSVLQSPVSITGAGTAGKDAQATVTNGGSVANQGQLQWALGLSTVVASNGTPQFSVYPNPGGAAEYWQALGAMPGVGGVLRTTNGTPTGNVNGTLVMQNQGQFCVANGSGLLGCYLDPNGPVGSYITMKPSNGSAIVGGGTAAIVSTGDLALVASGGTNRITVNVPDGTASGGNNRGSGSVDLQSTRSLAEQVASAPGSFLAGQNNRGSGNEAFCGGFGNVCDGSWASAPGGQNAATNGRYGNRVYSSGLFSTEGDAQFSDFVLRGNSVAGAEVQLVSDNTGAGSAINCLNVVANKTAAFRLTLVGHDTDTAAKNAFWFNTGGLSRDTTAASTVLVTGTPTTMGSDTVTVAATADTTIGCLSFKVTPDNSDSWDFVLGIYGVEVK